MVPVDSGPVPGLVPVQWPQGALSGHTYTRTWKGHLRYTSGPLRHKYVHRVLVARLASAGSYFPILDPATGELSADWDVHHMDGNGTHNCPTNLIVMPHGLHSCLTQLEARWRRQYLAVHMPQHPDV